MFDANLAAKKDKLLTEFRSKRKKYIALGLISIFVFLTIIYLGPMNGLERLGLIGQKKAEQGSKAEAIRGIAGDFWADIIIGQPDFSEISPNSVVANKLNLPYGVIIDRTSSPQKLYVFDSGNNRILGFNWDACFTSSTNPLNCSAQIVISQPSMNTSACNSDSGYQNYPTRATPGAATLCTMPEDALSPAEGVAGSSMDIDDNGNLYVNDVYNSRVLKYVRPFDTDAAADEVWGQNDFSKRGCNKGLSTPDATALCLGGITGVDVDKDGNLWVADRDNNRVLRFPAGSKTADLVLGQSGFTSRGSGNATNQLYRPNAVRVNSSGWVYVADTDNRRVLRFKPPLSAGMLGEVFGSGVVQPQGVDLDPTEPGKIWVMDSGKPLAELWDENSSTLVKTLGTQGDFNMLGASTGSLGIDRNGNVLITSSAGGNRHDVMLFAKGGSTSAPSKKLFGASYWPNLITNNEFGPAVNGVVVANNQLIIASGNLYFWNNPPANLVNGKAPDGLIQGASGSLVKADNNHLYVGAWAGGGLPARIQVYQLPLTSTSTPIKTINFPLPVLGGGQIDSIGVVMWGLAPSPNSDFLWVSQVSGNRVFRIRNPLTNPVVDIVLGQTNLANTSCNRGGSAAPDTLCLPGSLSIDRLGNLYVSDHSLETQGNKRLLVFNKDLLPTDNTQVIFAPSASKIFPNVATFEPAFDSNNRMVVGFNAYGPAPGARRFPGVYNDPLGPSTTPDAFLNDYYSMAFGATFDQYDNLYVADLNRARVLIYKSQLTPSPAPSPSASSTPTLSPSSSPSPISSPVGSDTLVPTVAIAEPLDGSNISGIVKISAVASDNVGVSKMELYIDNSLVTTADNATSIYYNWNTKPKKVSVGSHNIKVTASDAGGNAGSAVITVNKTK